MTKVKIQIKNRFTGNIIFEYAKENNTIKDTVTEALRCDADLRDANLCDANLCGADLCGANLCGANLCDADLCDADLRDANLRDADLCDADLRDANLCDANLCGADLCGANLCDANLCGANLCDADLRDANLCDANLRDANLCDANLCGAAIYYSYMKIEDKEMPSTAIEKNTKGHLKIALIGETHNDTSWRFGPIWRNVLRIKSWEWKEGVQELATPTQPQQLLDEMIQEYEQKTDVRHYLQLVKIKEQLNER